MPVCRLFSAIGFRFVSAFKFPSSIHTSYLNAIISYCLLFVNRAIVTLYTRG